MERNVLAIFRGDPEERTSWGQREDGLGGLTITIGEHSLSQDAQIPKPGYRPRKHSFIPNTNGTPQTHSSPGDWVVERVERFPAFSEEYECSLIVICHCKYDPVPEQWETVPTMEEAIDSSLFKKKEVV